MADTAAHLVDRVLPIANYRQWVLSLPIKVRYLIARDPHLLTNVLRIFTRCIFSWYRKQARRKGVTDGKPGAVTFIQKFGGYLNSNTHFHSVIPSGVFTLNHNHQLKFHRIASPKDQDIVEITKRVARRVSKLVQDYLNDGPNADDPNAHEQAIAEAIQVNFPFVEPTEVPRSSIRSRQCAAVDGYSIHANSSISEQNRESLERLCRYGARPPFAMDRLELLDDGRVRYRLKKPWLDGSTHLVLDPIMFMKRLASFIPLPYKNLTRYHGVFASRSKLRPYLVSLLPQDVLVQQVQSPADAATAEPVRTPSGCGAPQGQMNTTEAPPRTPEPDSSPCSLEPSASAALSKEDRPPKTVRPRRLMWAELLRRTFHFDITVCQKCQGLLILIAFITDPEVVYRILSHLNLPTQMPAVEPARQQEQLLFDFDDVPYGCESGDINPSGSSQPRAPPKVKWVIAWN
jgi:hypothetical protein